MNTENRPMPLMFHHRTRGIGLDFYTRYFKLYWLSVTYNKDKTM